MKAIMLELIEKFKKNSKLCMSDKGMFEKELSIILSAGEYTEDVETILCEGPVDSAMKVFAQFLAHSDPQKANMFVENFLFNKRFEENKGGAAGLRVTVLFSFAVSHYKEHNEILEKIFSVMIQFAYKNGSDQTNKKVIELMRTYILPLFDSGNFIMNLSFLKDENTWNKTRDIFFELISGEGIKVETIQKVFYWLKASGYDMGNCTEEFLYSKVLKKESSYISVKEDMDITLTNEATEKIKKENIENNIIDRDVKEAKKSENEEEYQEILGMIVSVLLAETKEITGIRSEMNNMCIKMNDLRNRFGESQIREKQQGEKIQELISENQELQHENSMYLKRISKLEELIKGLEREIDDRKQFADTVARNREKQSEENLNRLASKLKIDYRDYCDAKNLVMTIDLGENMREQLGSIFSILEKNGIKLK